MATITLCGHTLTVPSDAVLLSSSSHPIHGLLSATIRVGGNALQPGQLPPSGKSAEQPGEVLRIEPRRSVSTPRRGNS